MRTMTIQTGPGKLRTVYVATGRERRAYVRLAQSLARYERELATCKGVTDVAHGFVAGRNPVTMAKAHIGYDVTVSLDLADWFESVTFVQLIGAGVEASRVWKCCPDGLVRQGLPTSPAAANIAAVNFDKAIINQLSFAGADRVYTRYADDLTFSWRVINAIENPAVLLRNVAFICKLFGWSLNERKTRVQYASAGRRIICGLSVGETDVRATRKVRRRLRACQHARPNEPETRGLAEWAACKLPGHRLNNAPATRTIMGSD